MRACPECAEQIQDAAIKCRFCGARLEGAKAGPGGKRAGPSFVDSELVAGERVVYRTRLHWSVFPWSFAGFLAGIAAAGFFVWQDNHPYAIGCGVAAVLFLVRPVVLLYTSEFAVTNRRLIAKVGFVSRRSLEIQLAKVEAVQVVQGLLDRLLNRGDVVVRGTGGTEERFPRIAAPLELRRRISEQLARQDAH